jgi:hypothetical protein
MEAISAVEIRVGNYYDHNGDVRQVTPSTIEEVWNAKRQWCKPIPLTEEWLLRFGFDNWFGKEYILSNGHFYCVFKFYKNGRIDTYFCGQNERFKNKDTRFIKYVHQLQNLYFALTGEELTTQELNQ